MSDTDLEALAARVADKIRDEAMWGQPGYLDIARGIVFAITEYEAARLTPPAQVVGREG